jgi:integrase
MASLRARHLKTCPLYPWTTFEDARGKNGTKCMCAPTYHIAFRVDGRLRWKSVGKNRKVAQRALDAHRGDEALGKTVGFQTIRFDVWADEWVAAFTGKENTRRVYKDTVTYAKRAFGSKQVHDLGEADIRRFLALIREANDREATDEKPARQVSDATLARHLRTLGVCLQAAVSADYAATNPVRKLHKTHRPRPQKTLPSYFTTDELTRLWPQLANRPVYLAFCKIAVSTGMRCGELSALRWSDVDLLHRELHVLRAWTPAGGETSTKSGESRTIDLTPQVHDVLENWYRESGGDDHELVFVRDAGGRVDCRYVVRHVLYEAMEAAGIPRIGERGRARTFHSFRHTFARLALEAGAEITWVQRQLGHSTITLTVDTYGSWARAAEKAQARKLSGVFPV